MKKFYFLFILLFFSFYASADNYTVEVGSVENIYCTVNPPAGYITHAFFSLVDPSDAEYLQISYNSSDLFAQVLGIKAKSSIKIEVTYAYSYMGSYDGNIHVGHSSYYTYVTVKGGVNPTNIAIIEGDVSMRVGETIELNAKLTPSNASTTFTWGTVTGLGKPYAFDLTYIGPKATIKAKSAGDLYVVVQTENNLYAGCVVTAVKEDIPASDIELKDDSVRIGVGKKYALKYELTPISSTDEVKWSSSDDNIVSISSSGIITGVNPGKALIKASVSEQVEDQLYVEVLPVPESVFLEPQINMYLGYPMVLVPSFIPVESLTGCKWSSSNSDIASVDSSGKVTAKRNGNVIITVITDEGCSAECNITVNIPKPGMDYRNAKVRVNTIKEMVDRSLENNRK